MGRRGPPPTPTPQLMLAGSKLAKNRKDEPQPSSTTPRMPTWLRPDAKTTWKRVVPQLQQMGVLGNVDANALGRYCELHARWVAAAKAVRKGGETVELKNAEGDVYMIAQRPEAKLMMSLNESLRKLEAEFGMTPAGRARLAVDLNESKKTAGNDKSKFFGSA